MGDGRRCRRRSPVFGAGSTRTDERSNRPPYAVVVIRTRVSPPRAVELLGAYCALQNELLQLASEAHRGCRGRWGAGGGRHGRGRRPVAQPLDDGVGGYHLTPCGGSVLVRYSPPDETGGSPSEAGRGAVQGRFLPGGTWLAELSCPAGAAPCEIELRLRHWQLGADGTMRSRTEYEALADALTALVAAEGAA
jgi:hypothetical protein